MSLHAVVKNEPRNAPVDHETDDEQSMLGDVENEGDIIDNDNEHAVETIDAHEFVIGRGDPIAELTFMPNARGRVGFAGVLDKTGEEL